MCGCGCTCHLQCVHSCPPQRQFSTGTKDRVCASIHSKLQAHVQPAHCPLTVYWFPCKASLGHWQVSLYSSESPICLLSLGTSMKLSPQALSLHVAVGRTASKSPIFHSSVRSLFRTQSNTASYPAGKGSCGPHFTPSPAGPWLPGSLLVSHKDCLPWLLTWGALPSFKCVSQSSASIHLFY